MHSISNLAPVWRSFNLNLLRSRLQVNRYDMTEKRSLSLHTNRKFTTAKVIRNWIQPEIGNFNVLYRILNTWIFHKFNRCLGDCMVKPKAPGYPQSFLVRPTTPWAEKITATNCWTVCMHAIHARGFRLLLFDWGSFPIVRHVWLLETWKVFVCANEKRISGFKNWESVSVDEF